MNSALPSFPSSIPLTNSLQQSSQLLTQITFQMKQLLTPINILNQQLFHLQKNTTKHNYQQNYDIYMKMEQYNILVSQYNFLHEYQLILSTIVAETTSNTIKHTPKHEWKPLSSIPGIPASNPVQINDNEFIYAIINDSANSSSLCCYNIKTNSWNLLVKYPGIFTLDTNVSMIYRKKTNELYLTNGPVENICILKLAKININSSHVCSDDDWSKIYMYARENAGSSSILIDDTLHCFGGNMNSKHKIIKFDNKEEIIEKEICNLSKICFGSVQHGLIHLSNKNKILLFGGKIIPFYPRAFDTIWSYDIPTETWNVMNEVKLPYKMFGFGHILTADEKYIILIGGIKQKDNEWYENMDNIFVFELDTMKIKESKIKCPEKGTFNGISTVNNNNLLVSGFIRDVEKKCGVQLSSESQNVINKWYKEENVHIMHRETGKQWRIDLVEIISNTEYTQ